VRFFAALRMTAKGGEASPSSRKALGPFLRQGESDDNAFPFSVSLPLGRGDEVAGEFGLGPEGVGGLAGGAAAWDWDYAGIGKAGATRGGGGGGHSGKRERGGLSVAVGD